MQIFLSYIIIITFYCFTLINWVHRIEEAILSLGSFAEVNRCLILSPNRHIHYTCPISCSYNNLEVLYIFYTNIRHSISNHGHTVVAQNGPLLTLTGSPWLVQPLSWKILLLLSPFTPSYGKSSAQRHKF